MRQTTGPCRSESQRRLSAARWRCRRGFPACTRLRRQRGKVLSSTRGLEQPAYKICSSPPPLFIRPGVRIGSTPVTARGINERGGRGFATPRSTRRILRLPHSRNIVTRRWPSAARSKKSSAVRARTTALFTRPSEFADASGDAVSLERNPWSARRADSSCDELSQSLAPGDQTDDSRRADMLERAVTISTDLCRRSGATPKGRLATSTPTSTPPARTMHLYYSMTSTSRDIPFAA